MQKIRRFFYIILAIGCIAAAVNLFLGPHNVAAGGLTGLAIIVESAFGLDRAVVVLVANMVILVLSFFLLGKEFFLNTVIGATALPIIMEFMPRVMLVNDVMLSVVVGATLLGIGITILYKNNASSGGTAVPPIILKKYFNIDTSIGLFATDCFVVVASLFVFQVDSFFFAIFCIALTSIVMRYIQDGLNKKKMVLIVSEKQELILNDLLNVVKRGVTVIPVVGGHTKRQKDMLMVTLNERDYKKLLAIVTKYDETAFMVTNIVSDVQGGFTYTSGTV